METTTTAQNFCEIKIVQALPTAQKLIIVNSLRLREKYLRSIVCELKTNTPEEIHYEIFDILTLVALLQYDVNISMNKRENEQFTSVNGLDYPNYV